MAYGCQTPSAQRRSDQNNENSGHLRLCQQPRAAHALRSDQKSFCCNICFKVFSRKNRLQIHMQSHNYSIFQPKIICDKCIVDHHIVHGRLWFNSWIFIFINIIAFTFCQAQPRLSSRFSFSLLLCEASWAWAWHSSAPACYVLNSNKIKYINIRTNICSLFSI